MNFVPTKLDGCFVVEPTLHSDERGFFARVFCDDDFRKRGLNTTVAQVSVSYNRRRGTLRGLHYQREPHSEAKLVRCIRGRIFDVAVDIRPDSPTYLAWTSVELSADNRRAMYVPQGTAHGFLTLEDDSELLYQISHPCHPEAAAGIRWDDPSFGITWPDNPVAVGARDRSWPPWPGAAG